MVMERKHFTAGQGATPTKIITDEDIKTFGRISGDDNPVHVDDDYAKGTMFGGRIAHGMLVAGLISAVLGTQLPRFGIDLHESRTAVLGSRAARRQNNGLRTGNGVGRDQKTRKVAYRGNESGGRGRDLGRCPSRHVVISRGQVT
jgi:hypothetical protein